MLSKLEQQRLMNEHDEMSMVYLKNRVDPGELVEYSRGAAKDAKFKSWVGLTYVTEEKEIVNLRNFVRNAGLGKVIIGVTSFPIFIKCRSDILPEGNVDVVLFKSFSKDQQFLEFCTMVQELEELEDYDYTVVIDSALMKMGNVQFEPLSKLLDRNNDAFILPHQMMALQSENLYTTKNKRHYRCDDKYYYVSSFDPSFELDARSTLYYTIRSPVRFVRMKNSFACCTSAFKSLTFSDYYFDKTESIFLSLLQTEKCLFLTSPKTFYIEEEPHKQVQRSR